MIVTEEEAKTLWCPEAGANGRLPGEPPAQARCIASACMAWRWRHWEVGEDGDIITSATGYCGKAGRP